MLFVKSIAGIAVLQLCSCALSQQLLCQSTTTPDIENARNLFAQSQFKPAEASLRRTLTADPSSAEAHYLLAAVLLRENLPKDSLAEYTRAAALRTPSANDLRNVGLDYVLLNDYPEAEKWTLRAIDMEKSDPESWYSLGRIRYSRGRFQQAIVCFQQALLLAPRSVKAETNLGLAYEGLNQIQKATQAYETAIDLQKDAANPSAQPLIDLAIVLLHNAELPRALTLLHQAVEIAPADPRAHEQLGLAFLDNDQLGEAQKQFETAVSLSPMDPRLHFLLGRVYRREGMMQKAQDEFTRTASLNGNHSTPHE